MLNLNPYGFGQGDNSYKAAGELEGITKLVEAFYFYLDNIEEAADIRAMHPKELQQPIKKLSFFLSGWLGGPKLYAEHFGGISIPSFHRPFPIGDAERDAWLLCMEKAIADQDYQPAFKQYLYQQLTVPAQRIRQVNVKGQA